MAMGTRKHRQRQEPLWVTHTELTTGPGHPFYESLGALLDAEKFDEFVEKECAPFYAEHNGRPSLPPGIYFRTLMIGYFEGIDSERGIAWRIADSLGLRRFLQIGMDESTPHHSTISRTRRLIDLETHRKVFVWVSVLLADRGLLKGRMVGIDATVLEANAAMRSIVRRDNGQKYEEFLTDLAKQSGITTPTREDLARVDRKREKKGSNQQWVSETDADARIAKMKDGSTHMAHKAEHAVDMESGAVVAVTLQGADQGDTTTIRQTLAEAGEAVVDLIVREAVQMPEAKPQVCVNGISEVVADKGYHSGPTVMALEQAKVRTYIPEPRRAGQRNWEGKAEEQRAVYANRRRVSGHHGKRLLKKRGELIERSFAHCYETGAMRRTHLRGRENILKRLLIHVGSFNMSLIFRRMLGAGTPREFANRLSGLIFGLLEVQIGRKTLGIAVWGMISAEIPSVPPTNRSQSMNNQRRSCSRKSGVSPRAASTTGSQKEHSDVELFCGNTPLSARPAREAFRGIHGGLGKRRGTRRSPRTSEKLLQRTVAARRA
jgi:transposase